jgi:hypothetical protein
MSTYNKLFCQALYEKGIPIDAATLKGPPGVVTTSSTTKGDKGKNGHLNMLTITTTAIDVKIDVPSAVDSPFDVYHIIKPIESTYDIHVMNHLNVEICTLYAEHLQEVMLYKRDTEWVF